MEKRRVVITGVGAVTPVGNNVPAFWEAIRAGKCGIGPITHFDASNNKASLAAEVKDFQPETVLDKKELRHMDRFTQFAMVAAHEAMADSGLDMEKEDPTRCGTDVSSGIGGLETTEAEHSKGLQKGFDRISPFYIPMTIANMAAGQIAIAFGLKGMCACPVAPAASTPWATLSVTSGTATPRSWSAAAPRPPSPPWASAASPP